MEEDQMARKHPKKPAREARSPAPTGQNDPEMYAASVARRLRQEGSAFVAGFLEARPAATALRLDEPTVCWGDAGVVNFAVVEEHSGPNVMDGDPPVLFRIRVNLCPPPELCGQLESAALRRKLHVPTPPIIANDPALEVTALPEEVGQFGAWVSAWCDAWARRAAEAPPPPIPLFSWMVEEDLTEELFALASLGPDWRDYLCLWTAGSHRVFSPWLRKED
jgi:hypothetical protein